MRFFFFFFRAHKQCEKQRWPQRKHNIGTQCSWLYEVSSDAGRSLIWPLQRSRKLLLSYINVDVHACDTDITIALTRLEQSGSNTELPCISFFYLYFVCSILACSNLYPIFLFFNLLLPCGKRGNTLLERCFSSRDVAYEANHSVWVDGEVN